MNWKRWVLFQNQKLKVFEENQLESITPLHLTDVHSSIPTHLKEIKKIRKVVIILMTTNN